MLVEHVMGFEYLAFAASLQSILVNHLLVLAASFCFSYTYTFLALGMMSIPVSFVFAEPMKRPEPLTFTTPLPWDITDMYMIRVFRHDVYMFCAQTVTIPGGHHTDTDSVNPLVYS